MTLISTLLIQLIHLYQILIDPLTKSHCRFQKTCSKYGIYAINKYGALKGTKKTLIRILKCHPYNLTIHKKWEKF